MLTKKEISFNEVLRRWAIGEIKSKIFGLDSYFIDRENLKKGNFSNLYIIEQYLPNRKDFIFTICLLEPKWYLIDFKYIKNKFPKLYTIKDNTWFKYSNNTYNFSIAADYLIHNKNDQRVNAIINSFENLDCDDFLGIALIKPINKDYYIITEGHARMVAIYNKLVIKKERLKIPIKITIGYIKKDDWVLSPLI